ncbi:hypothetical protein KFE25_012609 [Diacronema lutheri]|uniref:Uncharacterized protein n=1 Tax=Diacronema lutheri TaxID=2081491 RepID=A0A8J6CBM5_DIALT|nr:hypothetical protein KFE25_012609 [Diacronema lutheri]
MVEVDPILLTTVIGGLVALVIYRDHALQLVGAAAACQERARAAPRLAPAARADVDRGVASLAGSLAALQPSSHPVERAVSPPSGALGREAGVHAPREGEDGGARHAQQPEQHVRARLKFTVDGNLRWLRGAVDDSCAPDALAALDELWAVLEHLQGLGRLGRQRTVEYCNALVDADGLALLHALSEGKRNEVRDERVRAVATRLFRELVPLIWS